MKLNVKIVLYITIRKKVYEWTLYIQKNHLRYNSKKPGEKITQQIKEHQFKIHRKNTNPMLNSLYTKYL